MRRDWIFSSGIWCKLCSFVGNAFWCQWFPETNQAASLKFGLLLKDEFFLVCPEVGLSNVALKVDRGYTCSEELNNMLAIAMLVPPISLWSLLSLASTIPEVLGWMGERHMETFLPLVDTWHWLPDFPDLASRPCRLGVDETSGMQKCRCWEYLFSDEFLQILLGKVSDRSCLENCRTPNLLSHSDELVGTL